MTTAAAIVFAVVTVGVVASRSPWRSAPRGAIPVTLLMLGCGLVVALTAA